jgi:hypothetical protein
MDAFIIKIHRLIIAKLYFHKGFAAEPFMGPLFASLVWHLSEPGEHDVFRIALRS